MKTLFVMALFVISTSAFSAVYSSFDSKQSCYLYRVLNSEQGSPKENETLVYSRNVYGISLENLEVDFNNREVSLQVMLNVIFGLNRPLVEKKSQISADNTNFTNLVNHLNRKIKLFENICITDDNKIIYANEFEVK
jgi:hypothetical protein